MAVETTVRCKKCGMEWEEWALTSLWRDGQKKAFLDGEGCPECLGPERWAELADAPVLADVDKRLAEVVQEVREKTAEEAKQKAVYARRRLIAAGVLGAIVFALLLFFHVVFHERGVTIVPKQVPNLAMPVVFVSKLVNEWNAASLSQRMRMMANPNYAHLMDQLERRGIVITGE